MFGRRQTESERFADSNLLGWIWNFIRPYRRRLAAALMLMPVYSLFALAQPYVIKLAIDLFLHPSAAPQRHRWLASLKSVGPGHGILLMGGCYALLVVGEFCAFYGQYYLTMVVAQLALSDLRLALFRHIERLPMAFFDRQPSGQLVSRITTDIDAINEMFNAGALSIITDLLILISVVALMLNLSPHLALWTLGATAPVLLAVKLFQTRARQVYRRVRRSLAALSAYISEALVGIVTIQLFTAEERAQQEFDGLNRACRDALMRANVYEAGLYSLVEAASAITMGMILWVGGYRAVGLGTLVAFIEYAQKFFLPLREMSTKYTALQSALAAIERISSIMRDNPLEASSITARRLESVRGEIVFDRVCFSYRPDEPALSGLSLRVEPGQKVAIVGPTGAGKSTIVKLLARFYDVDSGRILLDGVDVKTLDLTWLRRVVGIVQQEVFIFSGTVFDNVRMGRQELGEAQVVSALKRAQAYDFVARLPAGLYGRLEERGTNLSTGQRQLLAFARALAYDPPILVMDEATSNVDGETERLIQIALDELLKHRTALIIAHRLSTIEKADRILVVSRGKVRESGTHEELLARRGLYYRLFELQYGMPSHPQSGQAET
jgi:ATP-binding cassette subfamily B multidrug efflux pump